MYLCNSGLPHIAEDLIISRKTSQTNLPTLFSFHITALCYCMELIYPNVQEGKKIKETNYTGRHRQLQPPPHQQPAPRLRESIRPYSSLPRPYPAQLGPMALYIPPIQYSSGRYPHSLSAVGNPLYHGYPRSLATLDTAP